MKRILAGIVCFVFLAPSWWGWLPGANQREPLRFEAYWPGIIARHGWVTMRYRQSDGKMVDQAWRREDVNGWTCVEQRLVFEEGE